MRMIIGTLAGLAGLAAVSVQAAPLPSSKAYAAERDGSPPIELVRDGCDHGWHRHHWRDQWGYWHWGYCIPDGDPYRGWAPAGTILTQIGAVPARGVGVIHNKRDARRTFARRRLCGAVG